MIYADCKLLMEEYPKLPPRKLVERRKFRSSYIDFFDICISVPTIPFTSLDYPLRRQFYNLLPMLLSLRQSRASKLDNNCIPVVMTATDVKIESYSSDNVHRFSRKLWKNHVVDIVDHLRTEHLVPGQLSLFFSNFRFNHKRLYLFRTQLNAEEFIKILSPKLEEMNIFRFYFPIEFEDILSRIPNLRKLKMFSVHWINNWETSLLNWHQTSQMVNFQIANREMNKPLREIISNPEALCKFILRQHPSFRMSLAFSNVEESPDKDTIPEFYFYFQKVDYNLGEILSITCKNNKKYCFIPRK